MLDFPTCMQCLSEKLITNTLLTLELDPAEHTKRTLVAGKEELNFKDLQ